MEKVALAQLAGKHNPSPSLHYECTEFCNMDALFNGVFSLRRLRAHKSLKLGSHPKHHVVLTERKAALGAIADVDPFPHQQLLCSREHYDYYLFSDRFS